MNIFRFPQILVGTVGSSYGKVRYTFCSKRLAKLILKKSQEGKWVFPYFRTGNNVLFSGFVTSIVSNHGLLIMIKES